MADEIDKQSLTEEHHRTNRLRFKRSLRFAREDELAASIIHQLCQPLTSMLARAQAARRWLMAEPPNLTEATASMDQIASDVRTASETMQRIRALFKREPFDKRETSIRDIMSAAIRLVLDDPNKREVQIEWHFEKNIPKVHVDPLAIQEVFINLITNAIEALEETECPLIEFRATIGDQNVLLMQVIDNGPGIGDTERIFDSFVTTKENGLGIGLAVSRALAEAHGGRLWAENNPAGGAVFCLALPGICRNRNSVGH
jgi:hypothetical protein